MGVPTVTLEIEVTDDDILSGAAYRNGATPGGDPISRAAGRVAAGRLGPNVEASVGKSVIRFRAQGEEPDGEERIAVWEGRLPPQAAAFVERFDRGEAVAPLAFAVELRAKTEALILHDGVVVVSRCEGPDWGGGCPRVGRDGRAACAGRWIVPVRAGVRNGRVKVPLDETSCPLEG